MMMNNQMSMMLRQQMIRNPQQFAQNALNSGKFNNNPMYKNALEAIVIAILRIFRKIHH